MKHFLRIASGIPVVVMTKLIRERDWFEPTGLAGVSELSVRTKGDSHQFSDRAGLDYMPELLGLGVDLQRLYNAKALGSMMLYRVDAGKALPFTHSMSEGYETLISVLQGNVGLTAADGETTGGNTGDVWWMRPEGSIHPVGVDEAYLLLTDVKQA